MAWTWQYSGTDGAGAPISADGLLLTDRDPDGDGWFTIERITGQRDGVRIAGLYPAGEGIPGNVDPASGVPYTGDNLLRLGNPASEPQLNTHGLQFALADGSYSNVFYASFLSPATYLDFHSAPPYPAGGVPPNSERAVAFSAEPRDAGSRHDQASRPSGKERMK